ncbi:MAG: prepilin peptidase [Alphaproteobacteria bacterium]
MVVAVVVFYVLMLLAAAAFDVWRFEIPNSISVALVLAFVGVALAGPATVDWASHGGAAALVFVVGLVLFRFGIAGGGDVKLMAAIALWAGLPLLPIYLVGVALFGGLLSLALLSVRAVVRAPALARCVPARVAGWPIITNRQYIPYAVAISGAGLLLLGRLPILAVP